MLVNIQPSRICYSQDSINRYFDRHSYHSRTAIGQTLDDICDGRCSVRSIPILTVVNIKGKWVTSDNRRLWVFRHLERLGMCDTIWVQEASNINPRKLTSNNGGVSIRVRGDPGGYWHRQERSSRQTRSATIRQSESESGYLYGVDDDDEDDDDADGRRGYHDGYWDRRGPSYRQTSRTALTSYRPASYVRERENSRFNDAVNWFADSLQNMRIDDFE